MNVPVAVYVPNAAAAWQLPAQHCGLNRSVVVYSPTNSDGWFVVVVSFIGSIWCLIVVCRVLARYLPE